MWIHSISKFFYQLKITAMAKILKDIIETHWHKVLSPTKIFKTWKGLANHFDIYTVYIQRETGSCISNVRSTTENL